MQTTRAHAHRTHFGSVQRTHQQPSSFAARPSAPTPAHFSKKIQKENFILLKIHKIKEKYDEK